MRPFALFYKPNINNNRSFKQLTSTPTPKLFYTSKFSHNHKWSFQTFSTQQPNSDTASSKLAERMRRNFLKHLVDEEPEVETKSTPPKPTPKPQTPSNTTPPTTTYNFKKNNNNNNNYNNNNSNYNKYNNTKYGNTNDNANNNFKKDDQKLERVHMSQRERIANLSPNMKLVISKLDRPKLTFTLDDIMDIFKFVSSSEDIKDDKVFAKLMVLLIMHNEWNLVQELLQIMHNREIPFTARVYQALISGYLRNNCLNEAQELLEEMKQANIPDSYPVYRLFLKHYADAKDEEKLVDLINSGGNYTLDDDIVYDIIATARIKAIDTLVDYLKKQETPSSIRLILAAYIKTKDFVAIEQLMDKVGANDFVVNYLAIFLARGGVPSFYYILKKKNFPLSLEQFNLLIANGALKKNYDFVLKIIADALQRDLPLKEEDVLKLVNYENRGREEYYNQFLANVSLIFANHIRKHHQQHQQQQKDAQQQQ